MKSPRLTKALDAVTGTTTSNEIFIGSYKRVALLFRAAAISSGNGVFSVKGGIATDGYASTDPTMVALNTLIDNVTNTNGQQFTRVNAKTLSANGDVIVWISPETPVTHITITATVTTDGAYSAFVCGWED